jgi:uncharacterized Ntn-hydrolase superfamily protein
MTFREVEEAMGDSAEERHQKLMRKAVAELRKQYGWDERTAASVMLTITTAVGLAPKQK